MVEDIAQNMDMKQSDRAWMRERFLVLLTNLKGAKSAITMHGNTSVNCNWETTDGSFKNIIVSQLETPRPEILSKAVLRTSDIISIEIKT